MSTRKIGGIIFGTGAIIMIGFTIYKLAAGKEIDGINDMVPIAILLSACFTAITWGTKEEKDGILQEEELGQRITEKSSKISYFILVFFIFAAVFAEKIINGTVNAYMLAILGLSIIILPAVEFVVARKYQ
ncbi:hypothetical protein ACFQWB_06480 [Paenibacillus thermoaerophilus]|uniref:DUF2178 domain-containing protein n=1 Tax=Paenibacillus thermoaerophilus TaxID=1215385 RepID=A0ABW2V3Z6_9BACL|nr:hypothetical protein [Paenibacillus thermoaerophilus]TMV18160.1 hypothetical protein FE781_04180 [Paenibacillus thermoaerophilus]